tara:strand:- start:180 stop:368 length:189 start_codon:yes stop_codon:yes gene_type:complete
MRFLATSSNGRFQQYLLFATSCMDGKSWSIAAAISGAGLFATADDLARHCLSESQDFHRHLT